MLFGRTSKATREEAPEEVAAEPELEIFESAGRAEKGPFDSSEVSDHSDYVNLGAVLLAPREGLELRLEVEESSQRVIAVTLDLGESALQVQAFAAPRSEGVWDEIRGQIGQSVRDQGGQTDELDGPFGDELIASVPATAPDGSAGFRVARFVGVDGPRWFLRGVFSGPAAIQREAAEDLEDLFRKIIVVRGESPMPPRELLPLELPREPEPSHEEPSFKAPERGPEITQIG